MNLNKYNNVYRINIRSLFFESTQDHLKQVANIATKAKAEKKYLFPLEESDESTTSVVQTIVLLWVASPSTGLQAGMAAFVTAVTSSQASDA